MSLRTIMIFPEFENMDIIDRIRDKYDPLARLVRPHITIGKFQTEKELNNAYNDLKNLDESFTTIVNKISVEVIGKNEESIIVIEKML